MTKKVLLSGLILGGLAGGIWFWQSRQPVPVTEPEAKPEAAQEIEMPESELADMIAVAQPQPNQKVTSPLTVSGQARGTWFFEASAPVTLVDEAGAVLAKSYIETQGEWMSEDLVEFSGQLVFDPGEAKAGTLVVQNDNPSDIPENSLTLQIPVRFE